MTGRGRVLVVDDERHVRGLLRDLVEHLGYDASTAASGELAIAAMATEQPNVVLIDLIMPGILGLEVWRTYASITPPFPPSSSAGA